MTEDPRRRGPRWVSRAARVQEAVDDERRASGASSTSGLVREGSCCGRGLSKEQKKKEKEIKETNEVRGCDGACRQLLLRGQIVAGNLF